MYDNINKIQYNQFSFPSHSAYTASPRENENETFSDRLFALFQLRCFSFPFLVFFFLLSMPLSPFALYFDCAMYTSLRPKTVFILIRL